jgi:hypothetical protein
MAEARERRGVRGLASRATSRATGKHWAAAGAALLLLVTAPFGGLRSATGPAAASVRVGKHVRVGPYELTVRKVATVSDLAPELRPETDGDRLVVVVGKVRNPGTRPEYAGTLTGALRLRDAGVVSTVRPTLLSYADGQPISTINPGLTYEVAIVFEQAAGWTRKPVHLDVERLDFVHQDPLTLDADFWLATGRTARSGRFDVEVER